MQAPSPQPVCLFAFSFGQATTPIPLPNCAQLLLSPNSLLGSMIVGSTLPGMTEFTFPLGIQNSAGLAGLSLYAQSFHLPGSSLSVIESSPGLCITTL